jgi:hypothetical protein
MLPEEVGEGPEADHAVGLFLIVFLSAQGEVGQVESDCSTAAAHHERFRLGLFACNR